MPWSAEEAKAYRDAKRGRPPRQPDSCPSYAAFRRHERHRKAGKPVECGDPEGCREAYSQHQRKMHQNRKNRKDASS